MEYRQILSSKNRCFFALLTLFEIYLFYRTFLPFQLKYSLKHLNAGFCKTVEVVIEKSTAKIVFFTFSAGCYIFIGYLVLSGLHLTLNLTLHLTLNLIVMKVSILRLIDQVEIQYWSAFDHKCQCLKEIVFKSSLVGFRSQQTSLLMLWSLPLYLHRFMFSGDIVQGV